MVCNCKSTEVKLTVFKALAMVVCLETLQEIMPTSSLACTHYNSQKSLMFLPKHGSGTSPRTLTGSKASQCCQTCGLPVPLCLSLTISGGVSKGGHPSPKTFLLPVSTSSSFAQVSSLSAVFGNLFRH